MGAAGVKVSTLCLGAMTFGEADASSFMHKVSADESTSHAIIDRALDAGVNFIDTADVYGQDGLSERVLGSWIARSGKRDAIVLATKFRFTMGSGPNRSGASRYRIVRCVEESLRRLHTDRIDLYQVHMQDLDTPEEETLRALDDLMRAGKIVHFGCSNYAAYRFVDSQWIARHHHLARHVTLQAQYSLLSRDLEKELAPACRQWGVGILAYSPLASGFLSGKYRKGEAAPDGTRLAVRTERFAQFDSERNWRILAAVDDVAKQTGATTAQVALAWVIAKPAVTSVIFGARSVEQVNDNIAAAELALSAEQVKQLDDASSYDLGYPYDFMARIQGRW
jgi:aryl-alcohol dehydrogenase-like predicted oxidoreductase